MKNVLDIDGQQAVISYDPEFGLLRGEFLGLAGGADFYAKSTQELVAEGRKSLKLYLKVCDEKQVEPYKKFSGRFNLRLTPAVHEKAVIAAAAANQSLNEWIATAIDLAANAE